MARNGPFYFPNKVLDPISGDNFLQIISALDLFLLNK